VSRGGKKQLRRSLSISPAAYERLVALAALDGSALAPILEGWIEYSAARAGIVITREDAIRRAEARHLQRLRKRTERLEAEEAEALRLLGELCS
jgi:Na+/phosphate symporter